MVYNKYGELYKIRGSQKEFRIGDIVMANGCSSYAGLKGEIFEIRTGHDKDTDNCGPDIYVTFESPTEPELISQLEKRFSELYQNPTKIDELYIDEVIMAAEMLDVIVAANNRVNRVPKDNEDGTVKKHRSFTFRMYADIQFNRAIDPEKDYVSPGGYEMVMNGKTYNFDFCEYEGGRKPKAPNVLEFMQKNPDYDTFEDLANITEDDLKHLEKIKEFFVYLGEDGESEGLMPVKITGLWFEIIPTVGKIRTIECKNVIPYVFETEAAA